MFLSFIPVVLAADSAYDQSGRAVEVMLAVMRTAVVRHKGHITRLLCRWPAVPFVTLQTHVRRLLSSPERMLSSAIEA
jgi:hypothetical protein